MADDIQVRLGETGAPLVRSTEDANGKHHQHVLMEYLNNGALQLVTDAGLPVQFAGVTDPATQATQAMPVYMPGSTSAFGDQVTVKPLPQLSLHFPYGIAVAPVDTYSEGGGSISGLNSQAVLSTGAAAGGFVRFRSKDYLRYQPGSGATCRFTFGVTTIAVPGSEQTAGFGDKEDGYFFSYRNGVMNIVRKAGGRRNIRELTITAGSTVASNVTITLNNNPVVVPVSDNGGSGNLTAAEIAAADYAAEGFEAIAQGNRVVFFALETGARVGTFSFAAGTTGSTAAFAELVTGADTTELVIPQTSWNIDKADGQTVLPNIDWSKGNVFQIRYQWLGYGAVNFFIEEPVSGQVIPVHRIAYANANTVPAIFNPTLRFSCWVDNANVATALIAFTASVSGTVDGGELLSGEKHVAKASATIGTTQFEPILSMRAPGSYQGRAARLSVSLFRLMFSASAASDLVIIRNANLQGTADWQAVNSSAYIETDTASTLPASPGGETIWADRVEDKSRIEAVSNTVIEQLASLRPGETLTLAAQADTGNPVVNVTVNWIEPI